MIVALGGFLQPGPDRSRDLGRQLSVADDGLRDDEPRHVAEAVRVEHRAEVPGELTDGRRRHPGQDDAERGAPVPRVLEQFPDDGVGVAPGRRHEQPQVRGVEELARELPVGGDDGVDVRRVKQGDAVRHPSARGEDEQAVPARHRQALLAHPGQRGQEDVLGEPADLVGVTGEDGAVGRRPADPGRAHLAPGDAVQQRRLAGAGGADHGDQDRCARLAKPRQEVVLDLADHLLPLCPGRLDARKVEQKLGSGDRIAQLDESGFQLARIDADVRLSLVAGAAGHRSVAAGLSSHRRAACWHAGRAASRTRGGVGAAPGHRGGSRALSLCHASGPPLSKLPLETPIQPGHRPFEP